ncbi:MAG TPA: M23 family metallopeptidase [Acidimicrobiales bacterium]|nr:M23 family metallopeptidase [Acidimicrobiales bacterium]
MTPSGTRLGRAMLGLAVLVTLLGPVTPAAAHERYKVRRGDTLFDVAARLGVDSRALAAANGIRDPNLILTGQTLVVPPPGAKGPSTASGGSVGSYRVRPGDTLADLAPRLGVSPRRLAEANSLANPNRIVAGQTLSVPQAGRRATTSTGGAGGRGRWRCPVAGGDFVDDFGYVKPTGQVHQGVDLFAPRGTPIVAPVAGVVTSFPNKLGGKAVHLSGVDGIRYYAAHLDRYGKTGRVDAGTVIGYVGNSGDAVGGPTHLHLEVRPAGGSPISPYPLLTSACR